MMRSSWKTRGLGVLAAGLVLAGSVAATVHAGQTGVKVTAKYTGAGTVDESHRIWVWLFDTPEIGPGAMPIAEMSIDKNGAAVDFGNVAVEKVWIAVAYDEKGGFAGMAPPPSGSPVALYMDAGKPGPVTPGPNAAVSITFDDSNRMP